MRRVVIVGGGFSGSTAAVQLVQRSPHPLAISIIEPRAHVGGGLAYSSNEPDHRLNGQPHTHTLDPTDTGMFAAWCEAQQILATDPDARAPNGTLFMRRATFRAYLEDTVAHHATWPNGSSITHHRGHAVDVVPGSAGLGVVVDDGATLPCDMVILACGHTRARLPRPFPAALAGHARVIADPLASPQLPYIPPTDRVLVVGSSLTAYDAVSTLLSRGHQGAIEVVSRRGLRPRPQRPQPAAGGPPPAPMLDRIGMHPEAFIAELGPAPSLRALLAAVRGEIRRQTAAGGSWDAPFDHLRDMVGQVWPTLSTSDKRRFFRQLRAWYDVHRFRLPPQNSAIVHAAEHRGQVRFRAASLLDVATAPGSTTIRMTLRERGATQPCTSEYDRVINCTGVDASPLREIPLYAALLARGLVSEDPSGAGLAVDGDCRALSAAGDVIPGLRIIGPPTAGAQGDPLGSAFIAAQVHRVMPQLLHDLGIASAQRGA